MRNEISDWASKLLTKTITYLHIVGKNIEFSAIKQRMETTISDDHLMVVQRAKSII